MPAPFSSDLRERIVRAVAKGSSIGQAALRFEVSPSAAIKLVRRVRESGSSAPAQFGGHRRPMLDEHEASPVCARRSGQPVQACSTCRPTRPT